MVTQTFDFLYDFASPYTYLVHKVLPEIEARTGARAVYKPVLMGGIFKATGNISPLQVAAKLAYQSADIRRFVKHHNISYQHNPHFPVMTLNLMRGAIFATNTAYKKTYIDAVFGAMWIKGHKMDDPNKGFKVLTSADLPASQIIAGMAEPLVKSALITATQDAMDCGQCGAPTLSVGDEMFFGKDALLNLERALG